MRLAMAGALVLALVACGGKTRSPDADAGNGQADAAPGLDAAAGIDAAPGDDAGAAPCEEACDEGVPVALFHDCTPPLEVMCAARTCTPGGDECGAGETCVECSAAACCECAACVPSCVDTGEGGGPGTLPPLLKMQPTFGEGARSHEVSVEGAPFYVGALGYTVRLGDEELEQTGGSTCSLTVRVPAHPAGTILPVWVSQYGFGEPFVLAGFFSYIEGDDYPTCGQPGFPCPPGGECCATEDVPASCTAGRCRTD